MFNVKREVTLQEILLLTQSAQVNTAHIVSRHSRIKSYEELGLLNTDFITGFVVDKAHPDGLEYHMINTKGIIYIFNCNTLKLITMLGARPMQIRRYFLELSLPITSKILAIIKLAAKHVQKENINNL